MPWYINWLCYLFVIGFLSGCARWVVVGGKYTSANDFEVELPEGWKKDNRAHNMLRLTREGVTLQQITIAKTALENMKLSRNVLAKEVADFTIDNIRLNPYMTDSRIVETRELMVSGYPSFNLIYTFKTQRGLTMKGSYYGVLAGRYCYYLVYESPARHYFDKDVSTFEKIKDSFGVLTN